VIIKRNILLKAVVTPRLKEQLVADVEAAIQRVENAQDELDRQSRRLMLELQRTDLNRAMAFRQQIDVEKRKHEDVKAELQEQLQAYQGLELNTEIARGTMEGQVEINVGDNLVEKMTRCVILVEDDVIKEIRDPAPPDEPGLELESELLGE
jgi:hypothetical protein